MSTTELTNKSKDIEELKGMAFEVEDISYEARTINSMQEVLFQAIFRGEPTPEVYEWAFSAFGEMTENMFKHISMLRDNMFKVIEN